MANFFKTDLGQTTEATLSIEAVNKYGDRKLYFRIISENNYILQPDTKVRAMIAPSSASLSAVQASGLLVTGKDDVNNGYFYSEGGKNNTNQEDVLSFNDIEISDISWENQTFRLYWLITRGSDSVYGSNESNIYSLPHNVQGSEVIISGTLISNSQMQYNITWNPIENEGSSDYGSSPNDGPYWLDVKYSHAFTRGDYGASVSGFTTPIFYPSGIMSSGILIQLPFYDLRRTQLLPATYKFRMANVTASGDISLKPASSILEIGIDHGALLNNNSNSFKSLDDYVFNSPDKTKLVKVNELLIDENVINRKRLSIGINDISIKENTYVKQGIYISPQYPLDFNIYTFSLKVDEFIPEYSNQNKYDLVKYFVEFNSNKWEQISPLSRKDEFANNILVPKIFILDKVSQDDSISQAKYIQYNSNINSFRLKIVFDLSSVIDDKFIPPEIRDYKCIIYDKNQFFNL